MSDNLCLFGAGGHGRVIAEQLVKAGKNRLCFGDGTLPLHTLVSDIPVLFQSVTDIVDRAVIITIGDNEIRAKMQAEAEASDLELASFISPHSYYAADAPGAGSMVMAGSIVNIGVSLGRGVIVNSGAIVEHDAQVGDFCHLSPGSVMTGGVRLGAGVFLGPNATVLVGVSIVAGAVIGAGAVVTRDIDVAGVYVGAPAQMLPRNLVNTTL